MAEPTGYAFEYPDEAGYPDGIGTLSQDQAVLIDEVIDAPAFDFSVGNPAVEVAREAAHRAPVALRSTHFGSRPLRRRDSAP